MLALRSERRIAKRRNRHIEIRLSGKLTILRRVERALEIVNLRPDVNTSTEQRLTIAAVHAAKHRQRIQREIDLRGRARCAVIAHLRKKVGIEIDRIDKVEKRRARIRV